jgi:hypothetical protein
MNKLKDFWWTVLAFWNNHPHWATVALALCVVFLIAVAR